MKRYSYKKIVPIPILCHCDEFVSDAIVVEPRYEMSNFVTSGDKISAVITKTANLCKNKSDISRNIVLVKFSLIASKVFQKL